MASDLGVKQSAAAEAKKPSREILRQELKEAGAAIQGSAPRLFLSGLSAGLDIGFSPLLVGAMRTLVEGQLSRPVTEILAANLYAVGFIFVVLGRSELFTEQTTLAVLPVLDRRASLVSLARLWAIVYVANLVGTAIFAALLVFVGPRAGFLSPKVIGEVSHLLSDHPAHVIFLCALLAGWLMGLLSWLVAAARDTISQIVIVWLVAAAIGFAHLPHVIVGSTQMFAALFAGLAGTAEVGHVLLWATLGNIVGGGVFVALVKYGHTGWAEE